MSGSFLPILLHHFSLLKYNVLPVKLPGSTEITQMKMMEKNNNNKKTSYIS